MLALDLVVVGAVAFVLLRFAVRRGPRAPATVARVGSTTGLILALLLTAFLSWSFATFGHAVGTIGEPYDGYGSYRPNVLASRAGHAACER